MIESRTTPTLCVLVIATGPFRQPGFFDPGRAGHFAVAVQAEPSCINIVGVLFPARQDHGDAGSDRTFAHFQRPIAANQRRCADFHAGNIGNGVELSRRAFEGHAKIARPWACVVRSLRRSRKRQRHTELRGRLGSV